MDWQFLRYRYRAGSLPFRVVNYAWEFCELGLIRGSYRVLHELVERTGLEERTRPSFAVTQALYEQRCKAGFPSEPLAFAAWWRAYRPAFFVEPAGRYAAPLANILGSMASQVIGRANRALRGEIRCFGHWYGDYGQPWNWYLNPDTGAEWPRNAHGSRSRRYLKQLGEWKYPWELGRCPQVFDWVRAYALTGDEKYPLAFFGLVESFGRDCPYRMGVQWANGQEVAIRFMAWLYAIYALADSPSLTPERLSLVYRQLAFHAQFVREHIDFAYYAVYNNHLIGEALCLYLAGLMLPWLSDAASYRRTGRRLLVEAVDKQFYPDGGYVQNSNNYERLALHYVLWASAVGRLHGDDLCALVRDRIRSARDLLLCQQSESGWLPNHGANDGALLNPWTKCDFADFRPMLAALSYLLDGTRIYPTGLWDEELLWLFGANALGGREQAPTLGSASYPLAGLHILRRDACNLALFRCGPLLERFGGGDQLHVNLWWRGINVLLSPGSYYYLSDWARWFATTDSKNDLMVHGQGQTILYRDFKSLIRVEGKIISPIRDHADTMVCGEHSGYCRFPERIVHRRTLESTGPESWRIIDEVRRERDAQSLTPVQLHWLLPDLPYALIASQNTMRLHTPAGEMALRWQVTGDYQDLVCEVLRASERPMAGWVSRYYYRKVPALSLFVHLRAGDVRIRTEIGPAD